MTAFLVKRLKTKSLLSSLKMSLRKLIFSNAKTKFGLNILTKKDLLENPEKYHVLPFGSEESIVVSKPYNKSSSDVPKLVQLKIGTFYLKNPFVFEVLNAELVGPTAVGFDQEGNIISETILPEHYDTLNTSIPIRSLIIKNLPNPEILQMDTVCSLVNCWGRRNYFHWMVECLTRIEGLEYYQQETGRNPVLVIEPNPPIWKIESLKLLGYEPDDCVHWNMSRIKVKRLVVPSFRRDQYQISPAACRWVRQRILSNLPDAESEKRSFSSKIYISRSKAAGRQVINEADVLQALLPFGFVAYTLENMSFSDQVRLFSQAEIVVAPHGAGISNIIFSQNLILIELFGLWVVPCYFNLAKVLGFHYGCLKCKSPSLDPRGTIQRSDIMVDVSKLQALVVEMQELSVGK